MALSLGSTALSLLPQGGWAFGIAVLVLAFVKARVILLDYLNLRGAPSWRGGFVFATAVTLLVFLGLYAAPLMS
ncbi:cytochrome C oxidase subunit IV family protein [Thalassococcus sp. CAU 1522]|uniref:Cytochrome C oxidase subunit IV family protein n=1 Tax=Thalassococcus arenae TaxID=2851652 RepID=A0ABS6NDH4_9RHOB|nr:cytochrome C oxidase subunit IV family protein [Thalassococcus arenae]